MSVSLRTELNCSPESQDESEKISGAIRYSLEENQALPLSAQFHQSHTVLCTLFPLGMCHRIQFPKCESALKDYRQNCTTASQWIDVCFHLPGRSYSSCVACNYLSVALYVAGIKDLR